MRRDGKIEDITKEFSIIIFNLIYTAIYVWFFIIYNGNNIYCFIGLGLVLLLLFFYSASLNSANYRLLANAHLFDMETITQMIEISLKEYFSSTTATGTATGTGTSTGSGTVVGNGTVLGLATTIGTNTTTKPSTDMIDDGIKDDMKGISFSHNKRGILSSQSFSSATSSSYHSIINGNNYLYSIDEKESNIYLPEKTMVDFENDHVRENLIFAKSKKFGFDEETETYSFKSVGSLFSKIELKANSNSYFLEEDILNTAFLIEKLTVDLNEMEDNSTGFFAKLFHFNSSANLDAIRIKNRLVKLQKTLWELLAGQKLLEGSFFLNLVNNSNNVYRQLDFKIRKWGEQHYSTFFSGTEEFQQIKDPLLLKEMYDKFQVFRTIDKARVEQYIQTSNDVSQTILNNSINYGNFFNQESDINSEERIVGLLANSNIINLCASDILNQTSTLTSSSSNVLGETMVVINEPLHGLQKQDSFLNNDSFSLYNEDTDYQNYVTSLQHYEFDLDADLETKNPDISVEPESKSVTISISMEDHTDPQIKTQNLNNDTQIDSSQSDELKIFVYNGNEREPSFLTQKELNQQENYYNQIQIQKLKTNEEICYKTSKNKNNKSLSKLMTKEEEKKRQQTISLKRDLKNYLQRVSKHLNTIVKLRELLSVAKPQDFNSIFPIFINLELSFDELVELLIDCLSTENYSKYTLQLVGKKYQKIRSSLKQVYHSLKSSEQNSIQSSIVMSVNEKHKTKKTKRKNSVLYLNELKKDSHDKLASATLRFCRLAKECRKAGELYQDSEDDSLFFDDNNQPIQFKNINEYLSSSNSKNNFKFHQLKPLNKGYSYKPLISGYFLNHIFSSQHQDFLQCLNNIIVRADFQSGILLIKYYFNSKEEFLILDTTLPNEIIGRLLSVDNHFDWSLMTAAFIEKMLAKLAGNYGSIGRLFTEIKFLRIITGSYENIWIPALIQPSDINDFCNTINWSTYLPHYSTICTTKSQSQSQSQNRDDKLPLSDIGLPFSFDFFIDYLYDTNIDGSRCTFFHLIPCNPNVNVAEHFTGLYNEKSFKWTRKLNNQLNSGLKDRNLINPLNNGLSKSSQHSQEMYDNLSTTSDTLTNSLSFGVWLTMEELIDQMSVVINFANYRLFRHCVSFGQIIGKNVQIFDPNNSLLFQAPQHTLSITNFRNYGSNNTIDLFIDFTQLFLNTSTPSNAADNSISIVLGLFSHHNIPITSMHEMSLITDLIYLKPIACNIVRVNITIEQASNLVSILPFVSNQEDECRYCLKIYSNQCDLDVSLSVL
eukprot:TRINITY_DN3200_c0_g1_i2.p1 TRINITY_DN3200_c0_g1~~TRINITY_DN3200_c0_g1_i2.p1  ORF type:complete len:1378 (-),score=349.75 TRINITY_DN3200_c0_g1_i2:3367-7218(-)